MTRRWFEIVLPLPSGLFDEAAALLDFAGFGGVEVRDRDGLSEIVVVVETGASDGEAQEHAAAAHDAIVILGAGTPRIHELDPRIWTENWKAHFARRTFAGRIEVRPPWERPAEEGLLSIVINPGMAFGTGLHETTASCLELLVEEMKPGLRVADIGCGSGILAIAAARLGAATVLATDVDPLAVEATTENIAANQVGQVIEVELEPGEVGIPEWEGERPGLAAARNTDRDGAAERNAQLPPTPHRGISGNENVSRESPAPLTHNAASPQHPTPNGATGGGFTARGVGAFDLVVANILAETLVEMRDVLASAVCPGGTLVLSGIEARRLKTVEEAFIRSSWRLARAVTKGDWVSLSLHRDALAEPAQSASSAPASAIAGAAQQTRPPGAA